jgi:hypothetical protein
MGKFALSVVGLLAEKTEINMLKQPRNPNKKATPKMVAVIKNGHTDAELDEMSERWVNHQGPYLTLAEVIAIEKAKQDNHLDKP